MKWSFFPRKPNPAVPAKATQLLNKTFAPSPQLKQAVQAQQNAANQSNVLVGQAAPAEAQAPSNARFRSFCERYIVERCRDWKEGEVDERCWEAILQAKSIYNKVKEVGRTIGSDS